MPPRSFWKGHLKLSLVTCPVAMTPALTDGGRVSFHTLNARTGNRVQRQYVDAETGRVVKDEDQARGYPRGEDDYVLLEDDELDAVALDSTRTIDIDQFVPDDSIGWIWLDRPHFLTPDDPVGAEAFAVIREAMRSTGTVGIARLVLYRRERAVLLRPHGRGIALWTLRYGDEVRPPDEVFANADPGDTETDLLKLVAKLIDRRTARWTPDLVDDPVQDRLLDIIKGKRKQRKRARPADSEKPQTSGTVVDIMDALKRSIASERRKGGD